MRSEKDYLKKQFDLYFNSLINLLINETRSNTQLTIYKNGIEPYIEFLEDENNELLKIIKQIFHICETKPVGHDGLIFHLTERRKKTLGDILKKIIEKNNINRFGKDYKEIAKQYINFEENNE